MVSVLKAVSMVTLGFSLLVLGCSKAPDQTRAGIDPKPEVAAPLEISKSFAVQLTPVLDLNVADKALVTLRKAALEKEFLLRSELVQLPRAPMFKGLKSRVVAFRLRNGKLYLLEATKGHTVTNDLPQSLVLAEFDIIEDSESQITFDFNKGMSSLFVSADWRASDYTGITYGEEFTAVESRLSYIEEAKIMNNTLVIRQIAQLKLAGTQGPSLTPVEVKYYLSAYAPDTTFKPVRAKDFLQTGYFETAALATTEGADVAYSVHFHQAKPIEYAVSANTPPEFVDAVREGVLYWNQVFGKEVVRAIEAPQGTVAPDAAYNVIQWVKWDGAGGAYADMQMDPRSGEILHAQVYMTSAFAFLGKWRARELYKKLKPSEGPSAKQVSLAGFHAESPCELHLNEALAESMNDVFLNERDEAKLRKAAQDYVRYIVAHEVGHTLGLRHNFAGNLGANYALNERDQHVKSYLENGQTPNGLIATSSVMEYLPFEESILTGDQILRKEKPLKYDEKAIRSLYYGDAINPSDMPLFCADSHAAQGFSDCVRADIGSSLVEYTKWSIEDSIRKLPHALLSTYIVAKAPVGGALPVPVQQVSLNPATLAKTIMAARHELMRALTHNGKLLKIHRTFGIVGAFNVDKVKDAEMQYLAGEVKRAGSLAAVLSGVDGSFAEREYRRFEQLVDSGEFTVGVGPEGQKYSFTPDEITLMKQNVKLVYEKLQQELVKEDLNVLAVNPPPPQGAGIVLVPVGGKAGQLVEHELTDELAALNAQRVRDYTFASTGELLTGEVTVVEEVPATQQGAKPEKITRVLSVKLPKFLYPLEIRSAAPAILKETKAASLSWGLLERTQLKKDYTDLLMGALGGLSIDKVKPEELPKPMARWVLENKKVNAAVAGM